MEQHTPLRVGIVGCGYQGSILAQTIITGSAWQLVACADPDRAAAQRVSSIAQNVPTFETIATMLEHTDLDAVLVATSHPALSESALTAIRAGKHVLVEKPLGIHANEAAQLEQAVSSAKVIFMAGYSFRYLAGLQKVHELLQAGAVGEIQHITGTIGVGPMRTGWKKSLTTGGGPMLYVGSHLVDEILWYLGDEPVEVFAQVRYQADTQADETTIFQMRFARGATAQGMVTQTAVDFFNSLDIFGNQGRISLRGSRFTYEVQVVSNVLSVYAQPTTLHLPQIEDLRIAMHRPQLEELAQAIRERREPSCSLAQGRRVLQLIDAFYESGAANRPVGITE